MVSGWRTTLVFVDDCCFEVDRMCFVFDDGFVEILWFDVLGVYSEDFWVDFF